MPIVKFHENTTARKGLTYSKMTKYILLCENSEKYMCEFIRQREVSKTQKNPYHYMLDWFKVTFNKQINIPTNLRSRFGYHTLCAASLMGENKLAQDKCETVLMPGLMYK